MSDAKPRRAARDAGRSDIATGEAVPIDTSPTIAPEAPAAAPQPAADDSWTTLAETQAALTRGFEEAAVELTGMARSGFAATADAAIALLQAKTFADIVEINAGLARRGVDAMIEGSARLSEIGVKAVAATSRPLLSRLDATWSNAGAA
jgi:hypothetical protein